MQSGKGWYFSRTGFRTGILNDKNILSGFYLYFYFILETNIRKCKYTDKFKTSNIIHTTPHFISTSFHFVLKFFVALFFLFLSGAFTLKP